MQRYFIECAYDGSRYGGSQIQKNANTVQAELEKTFQQFYRSAITLTGSSRTDAGVHASQNFYHTDAALPMLPNHIYNLNCMLPPDIVIKNMVAVGPEKHCRFDAVYRKYQYFIYQNKDPFNGRFAWFYPYPLHVELLQMAAKEILSHTDFTSFCKRNTQSATKTCHIIESSWQHINGQWVYTVKANRFLRGMVRGLVGTMLQVGRGKIEMPAFKQIIEEKDCRKAFFGTPAQGLFLKSVEYGQGFF